MKAEDAAYLAGFVDGEGCMYADRKACAVRVMVGNTNEAIIRWVHRTVGAGSVFQRKKTSTNRVPLFVWQVSNAHDCREVLNYIRPYLKIKWQEADEILQTVTEMQLRMDELDARNRNILAAIAGGQKQKDIAAQFGISQSLVSRIKVGHTWPCEIKKLNAKKGLKKWFRPCDQVFRRVPHLDRGSGSRCRSSHVSLPPMAGGESGDDA